MSWPQITRSNVQHHPMTSVDDDKAQMRQAPSPEPYRFKNSTSSALAHSNVRGLYAFTNQCLSN